MSANQFVNYKITTLRVSETWPDHNLSHVLEMRSQLISFCTTNCKFLCTKCQFQLQLTSKINSSTQCYIERTSKKIKKALFTWLTEYLNFISWTVCHTPS